MKKLILACLLCMSCDCRDDVTIDSFAEYAANYSEIMHLENYTVRCHRMNRCGYWGECDISYDTPHGRSIISVTCTTSSQNCRIND